MCGGGGEEGGTWTVNVPFLIIQRALEVPFFYKVIEPFFVSKVNTIAGCTIAILVLLWTTIAITIAILL